MEGLYYEKETFSRYHGRRYGSIRTGDRLRRQQGSEGWCHYLKGISYTISHMQSEGAKTPRFI